MHRASLPVNREGIPSLRCIGRCEGFEQILDGAESNECMLTNRIDILITERKCGCNHQPWQVSVVVCLGCMEGLTCAYSTDTYDPVLITSLLNFLYIHYTMLNI